MESGKRVRSTDESSHESGRKVKEDISSKKKSLEEEQEKLENDKGLLFEDPFEDEYEEEELEREDDIDDEDDDEHDVDESKVRKMDQSADHTEEMVRVFRPGIDTLAEGEELEYDPSAYIMYHSLRAEWPCLSFDIMRDNAGDNRVRFPLAMYLVAGSQAESGEKNKLTILKLSDMHKTHASNNESDDEDDNDDDDNLDEDPTLDHVNIPHVGGVNRIRVMPQNCGIIATMSDSGHSHIYDASAVFTSMMSRGIHRPSPPNKPHFSYKGHTEEGYAIDWSLVKAGRLATGDCAGCIHVWNQTGASWLVDSAAYRGHTSSVEDLQWSPTEDTVFSSCSADRTVKIWDTRGRSGPQLSLTAHAADVNVISWNRGVSYLMASGSDDGSFKVWDLRAIREASPIAHFTHHKQAVTSIEWAPNDDSSLAVASADEQVTVWDLSVEADEATGAVVADFPPQLLFIHQGQHNVKELHYHPQIPGVITTTAEDGFNVFKPAIHVST